MNSSLSLRGHNPIVPAEQGFSASRRRSKARRAGALLRLVALLALTASAALAVPARSSPAQAAGQLAIVGARIYPAPDAEPIDDGVVIVNGRRIATVGARCAIRIPKTAQIIDARGAVVTAGFWNSHVHFIAPTFSDAGSAPASRLEEGLRAMLTRWGFTSVFDLASRAENTMALRRRIRSGEIAGPMILTAGDPFFPENGTPIYARDLFKAQGWPNEEVSTPAQGAARARRQLDSGTDAVKIFTGAIVGGSTGVLPMRLDIAKAIVGEAHRRGKPAFAHPSNLAGLNIAIDSGVDILAHTTASDGEPGAAAWPRALIARMLAHHMALIPTMTLFEVEGRKSGESEADLDAAIRMITREVRDYSAAGGQILFGTDVGYTDAYDTAEEFRLMSSALGWRQILASLTTSPARRFGFSDRGRIAPGMIADLVILRADPATDPTAFSLVRETIHAGRVIWAADRRKWRDERRQPDRGAVTLSSAMCRPSTRAHRRRHGRRLPLTRGCGLCS